MAHQGVHTGVYQCLELVVGNVGQRDIEEVVRRRCEWGEIAMKEDRVKYRYRSSVLASRAYRVVMYASHDILDTGSIGEHFKDVLRCAATFIHSVDLGTWLCLRIRRLHNEPMFV